MCVCVCVCMGPHSQLGVPVEQAAAGPPALHALLLEQRDALVRRLLQHLQAALHRALGRPQHAVQVHLQVTWYVSVLLR